MKKLFCFFAFLFLLGCKERIMECSRLAPSIRTYGYDSSEIDSILVTQYEKGTNFSRILEQRYLITPSYYLNDDASYKIVIGNWDEYYNSYENYDWKYIVAFDNQSLEITEAKRKINTTSYDHPASGCFSVITQLTINGSRIVNEEGIFYLTIVKP